MTNIRKSLSLLSTLALVLGATACSDASLTAPALDWRSSMTTDAQAGSASGTDTTVTTFVVGTNGSTGMVQLGNLAKIVFPYGAGSICDISSSSYGPNTWNDACVASKKPVTITAKSWINAQGYTEVDFQPAMRFVPGLNKSVTLALKHGSSSGRIDFRNADRSLVNEAATDASVASEVDTSTNWITRVIKHFSGYTVTAD